jgi:Cu(I)/Ag(I) efflux system membrane fusion protein
METAKKYFGSKKSLTLILAAVIVGAIIGYSVRGDDPVAEQPDSRDPGMAELLQPVDEEHAAMLQSEMKKDDVVYICPMNCVAPMAKPGRCPVCGMDLVAVDAQEHSHGSGAPVVTFSEETLRAAGIQVAPVERKIVTAEIRLFGKIEYDPADLYKVTAFAPGIIDRIYVKRAGQTVRRGDPLFDMHSSELYFLEEELFEVLKQFPDPLDYRPGKGEIFKRRMRPARRSLAPPKGKQETEEQKEKRLAATKKIALIHRKMQLLGLSKFDVDTITARSRPIGISTVTTPTTGFVLEQNAYKGAYVNTGETIFTIANPRYLWAKLDAYESDFAWLRLGQQAEFETDSYPGRTFKGKVTYLDPFFEKKTRTFKVGVLYMDSKIQLKPNMLVRGVIHARMTADGVGRPRKNTKEKAPLVIPESAPLITGKRAIVYVETPGKPGTFEAREVTLGPRTKGYYVVRHGLHEGENVVVNGNFKIDSAVQILAKPSMMEHAGGAAMSGHQQHGGTQVMDMEMKMEPKSDGPRKGQQHKMYRGHD